MRLSEFQKEHTQNEARLWRGRFSAWLKNRIDRRFMAQYRRASQTD